MPCAWAPLWRGLALRLRPWSCRPFPHGHSDIHPVPCVLSACLDSTRHSRQRQRVGQRGPIAQRVLHCATPKIESRARAAPARQRRAVLLRPGGDPAGATLSSYAPGHLRPRAMLYSTGGGYQRSCGVATAERPSASAPDGPPGWARGPRGPSFDSRSPCPWSSCGQGFTWHHRQTRPLASGL